MRPSWTKSAAALAIAALVTGSLYAPQFVAHAQPPEEAPPPAEAPAPTENAPAESETNAQKVTLATVVNQMSKASGITILIDRSVPILDVAPPAQAAAPDTLEAQLTMLTESLPKGTTWTKVNLPERTRSYSPDAVGDFVMAQMKLFGGTMAPAGAGTVEVLGQKLTGEKAQAVADALALRPVYLLINPDARNAPPPAEPAAPVAEPNPTLPPQDRVP